jgi:hypothetical protein
MFSATTLSSSLLIWSLCSPHYALAAATRKQTIQGVAQLSCTRCVHFRLLNFLSLSLSFACCSWSSSHPFFLSLSSDLLDGCQRMSLVLAESAELSRDMASCGWCERVASMVGRMKHTRQ